MKLYSTMLSFIVLLLAQAVEVYANGRNMPTARFINPEPAGPDSEYKNNPVYKVGDTVEFRWFTTLDKVGIIMWQQYPDLNAGRNIDLLADSTDDTLRWKVTRDWMSNVDKSEHGVAFLALYESGSTQKNVISNYFNITVSDGSTSNSDQKSTTSTTSRTTETRTNELATTVTSTSSTEKTVTQEPTVILMTASETAKQLLPSASVPSSDAFFCRCNKMIVATALLISFGIGL